MKVHELIQWLQAFEYQNADVLVVVHCRAPENCPSRLVTYQTHIGRAMVYQDRFDPAKHTTYYEPPYPYSPFGSPYGERQSLLIGAMDEEIIAGTHYPSGSPDTDNKMTSAGRNECQAYSKPT